MNGITLTLKIETDLIGKKVSRRHRRPDNSYSLDIPVGIVRGVGFDNENHPIVVVETTESATMSTRNEELGMLKVFSLDDPGYIIVLDRYASLHQ